MAIRDKIKAKFSSKHKSNSSISTPSNDEPVPGHYTGRTDIEYYKPNEIPKSKYRGRVDKEHQEKLETFSFGDAFQAIRRPSAALSGTFSPGGTRAFSRRTSYASNAGAQTPARSRRSSLSSDANNSFSVPSSESASTHMRSTPSAMTPATTLTESTEDDTDVTNIGLSKVGTVKDGQDESQTNENIPTIRLDRQATANGKDAEITNGHIEHSHHSTKMPFTPEELTQAISQVTVTPQVTARKTSVVVA